MGSLNVNVVCAKNLVNVEAFGKSDPYTIIEFKGQKKQTKVIEGNLDPEWNEALSFDLAGLAITNADMLIVKVMDKEKIGHDRLLGTIDISLNELAAGKTELKLNVNLLDKNKRPTTGLLNLIVQYQPPKRPASESTGVVDQTDGNVEDGFDAVDSGGPSQAISAINKTRAQHLGKRGVRKTYSTKPQDFQIRVKVVEARQLAGSNISPVCKVICKNQAKQTQVKKSTNSPFWNSTFFFNFYISASELLDELITFEVFNSHKLRANSSIGSFKFDLSMIFEESKHAFLNKWLLLSDPDDTNSGAKGYLKISTAIVGPGDEAPSFATSTEPDAHDIETNLIRPAGIQLRAATFILKVYGAEDLPKMDPAVFQGIKNIFGQTETPGLVDPYFTVSFAGKEVRTSTKYGCDHPDWNEELKIGLQFPSMCDRLKLQLFDWDRIGNNDAIGTVFLDISSIGSMKDELGFMPTFGPCFINFYGGPREFSDLPDKFEELNLGKGDGVAYRGRVLLELTTQFNETSEPPEPVKSLSNDQLLRVSKFLRRRKYRLHAVMMGANMIRDVDSQIEFEIMMGNYGNKLDENVQVSNSKTQPTNAVFDGMYYYFLPWGNEKPCCVVDCHWEDISSRLFTINYFLRIADRLTTNINKIKVAMAANIPEEEQAQFVISTFDDLLMSCSKPMPTWEGGESPETELDKNLRILRQHQVDGIKKEAIKMREAATSVEGAIQDLEGFATELKNLSIEPQNSMPDVIVWLTSGNKRKHYTRIPAHDLIWSSNEDFRGRFCGVLQTLAMKTPILLEEKDIKDLMIPGQLRIKLWLGLEKDEVEWHRMQKEGKLTVLAETYENQASLLGKWSTKSPLMTRPAYSDASGRIDIPKDKIKPPPGWAWDGDWFISPETSLYFDKNALLTEYLEDLFVCEMRVPGGNWSPAKTQYTNVKGDPFPGPGEIALPEGWKWSGEWKIDFNRPCDEEGWEYAIEASLGGFQPAEKMYHMCRRRRMVRQRKQVSAQPPTAKGVTTVSADKEAWEYAPIFDLKFHAVERKIDMVRRRRWHRKMIANQPGAPCVFNLSDDGADKSSMASPRMFLKFDKSYKWQLRAYLFQARELLAADQNGFSDAYARVVCSNQSQKTEIQMKSICPTWDQTLIFKGIEIHNDPITVREYPPKIVIELFDYDVLGEDEFLGRCEAYPMVKLQPNDPRRAVLQWLPVIKGSKPGGEILAAFEIYLIGEQDLPFVPPHRGNLFTIPDGIRPMMQRTGMEILTWGVRNMKNFQLVNVVSPEVELEIGGNIVRSSFIKNTKKNPNFPSPLTFIDVMLPKEELYMPPININVRDRRPFGRKPIVGSCCIKSTEQFRRVPLTDVHDSLEDFPEFENAIMPRKVKKQHNLPKFEVIVKGKTKKVAIEVIDEDIDWWTKYYASYGKTDKCHKYLNLGYDTINIYTKELESSENFNDFDDFCSTFLLYRGSNDYCDEDDENDNVGEFKGTFRIYPLPENKDDPMPFKYLENSLPSSDVSECLVRVYIVKAYDLQPEDPSGLADPYIDIHLGKEYQTSKEEYIPNTLTPEFGRMFELKAKIPVAKDLKVSVMDYDLMSKDDVIGETVIDLENRFLTKFRALCGLPETYSISGINQWRDSQTPTAILAQFCAKNRFPTPEYVDETSLKIGQKFFNLSEMEIETEEPNPHLGPAKERLALHVLHKLPFVREHVEVRSLYSPLQPGIQQGKVEMWVDIFPVSLGPPGPPFNIRPRFAKKFELRIVVKNTYDVVLDETNLLGEKMSDIYVKGWISGVDEKQQTDVHYRSLDGEGNFNWRFVFPFDYIPSENCLVTHKKEHFWSLDRTEQRMPCKLIMQVWDNDIFSPDDFLGMVELDLSAFPAPVKKASACTLEQLAQFGGTEVINLFECKRTMGVWPVFNNESGKPELTGKLELEIDLLTEADAILRPAGCSRDDPNENPHLDPPNRPATSFFWFTSPWKSFKFLIWNNMKYKLITFLVIVLLVLLAVLFIYAVPALLARKMIIG